jgi:hypothetical protein
VKGSRMEGRKYGPKSKGEESIRMLCVWSISQTVCLYACLSICLPCAFILLLNMTDGYHILEWISFITSFRLVLNSWTSDIELQSIFYLRRYRHVPGKTNGFIQYNTILYNTIKRNAAQCDATLYLRSSTTDT